MMVLITYQTLPRIFVQEPHCDVKGGTTPALQTVCVRKSPAGLLRDVDHINRAQTSGQKGLMRVTPGRVHDEHTRVLANGLRECLGALLDDDVTPSKLAREGRVEWGSIGVLAVRKLGNDDLVFQARLALLTLDRRAIDGQVSEVSEQLLRTVLALDQLEKLGGVIDELQYVCEHVIQVDILVKPTVVHVLPPMKTSWVSKRNKNGMLVCVPLHISGSNTCVGKYNAYLDTTNTELHERTKHLTTGYLVRRAAYGHLHEQAIVVRLRTVLVQIVQLLSLVTLTVICAPAKPELASSRTPLPPALR